MLPPLSATIVDASVTTQATAPPQYAPHRTTVPPTNNHPTMKTLLLEINNVLTLLLILVNTHSLHQSTTKPSRHPPLITRMIINPTSHGPIQPSLRRPSIHLCLIMIIFQLPTMLHLTQEPLNIFRTTNNHYTNTLVHHSYPSGYLTVASPATLLHSSVTSVMPNPAVSPSPLLTVAQNYLPQRHN